jgi:hypothetical protein
VLLPTGQGVATSGQSTPLQTYRHSRWVHWIALAALEVPHLVMNRRQIGPGVFEYSKNLNSNSNSRIFEEFEFQKLALSMSNRIRIVVFFRQRIRMRIEFFAVPDIREYSFRTRF